MTLSCLTCKTPQRTNSDLKDEHFDARFQRLRPTRTNRNWSGRLFPCSSEDTMKTRHRHGSTTTDVMENVGQSEGSCKSEPRLVRSPGMRRDWSFEDLTKKNSIATRA
ncbi:pollen-specific small CDPK-interacting protein 1 [Cinnamomum micranthum f. kanehirae]|uniref:Pollen-specific small CDPK-interacting protein 1 n=1 Tax=Cinnamomum micranthum f. kanehirae TaxID=337451 RepID=A0A443PG06_9MAGN|nr:pollen-specific small CDPK-interacting protein 1 [Cinnamomum micranthum f. kanehirae]